MERHHMGGDDGQLHAVIERARERYGVPGLAVALAHAGGEAIVGRGVTSVEHPLPVDGETLFRVGSIAKPLTATAVMRLVERGALALDVPVWTYLPELGQAGDDAAGPVTLAHLLTHTAGWENRALPDTGPGDDALARLVATLDDLARVHPPGTHWESSNLGYAVLGRVVEVATGQTYEAAVAELVLTPLGMARSCFSAAEAITHRVAIGHRSDPAGPVVARPWGAARVYTPPGGLISSAADLLRFARFHLGDGTAPDGERLLSAQALAEMRAPRHAADWAGDAVGLGWFLRRAGEVEIAGHDGVSGAYRSALLLVPPRGFALAVLANGDRGAEAAYEIATWALGRYLDAPRAPAFDRYLARVRPMAGPTAGDRGGSPVGTPSAARDGGGAGAGTRG